MMEGRQLVMAAQRLVRSRVAGAVLETREKFRSVVLVETAQPRQLLSHVMMEGRRLGMAAQPPVRSNPAGSVQERQRDSSPHAVFFAEMEIDKQQTQRPVMMETTPVEMAVPPLAQ